MPVDLTDAEVIDNHCHGFTQEGLLAVAPEDFETRLTLMGMGFSSSAQSDPETWERTRSLTESTAYSLMARRWMASRDRYSPSEAITCGNTVTVRLPSAS